MLLDGLHEVFCYYITETDINDSFWNNSARNQHSDVQCEIHTFSLELSPLKHFFHFDSLILV